MAGTTSFSITLTKTCFSGTHLFKNKINAVFFTIKNKIYVMDSPNFPIILCHINLWLPHGSDGREPAQLALVVKSPPANAGNIRDVGLIPGWGRSPGGGHGNPLQYSRLEIPHGQRSLAGVVDGVTKSDTTEAT